MAVEPQIVYTDIKGWIFEKTVFGFHVFLFAFCIIHELTVK